MADSLLKRRLKLAYPFTILTDANVVRLVAGEDHRYTLRTPGLDSWLPHFLRQLDGKATLEAALGHLPSAQRSVAIPIVGQLFGERVLVDGSAAEAHSGRPLRATVEGTGSLKEVLAERLPPCSAADAAGLAIYCQDRLDYEAPMRVQRRCRQENQAFLWVSYAAMTRAYVSPLFLADAGPCFGCLLRSFQRLSPAPELYDALAEHGRLNREFKPADFPEAGLWILQGLVIWKLAEAERAEPDPGLYRLHVLEREHFEVTTHRVFPDPLCPMHAV